MIMTDKRFIFATLAVFAAMFVFNWLFHGVYMMPDYEATASLWRPMEEMNEMFLICLSKQLALAAVITWLFAQNYEGKGIPEGLRFGLAIGVLMGLLQFGGYVYMPISFDMALSWLAGGILLGVILGLVLARVFECKCFKKEGA